MDKINLGKVCVTPRGDYSASTLYEALDIVMHLGVTYICIDPSLPLTDPAGWMVIARTSDTPGKDGEKGETGKSAYEEAVDLGFSGTVEEWVVSLKGEKGLKGDTGEKGEPGEKGEKGKESTVNGKTSVQFEAGDNIIIDEVGDTIKIHSKKGDVTKSYVDEQLSTKVNKEAGKVLSTNDYTSVEKQKLAKIEDGANNYNDAEVRAEISRVEAIASGRNSARVFEDLADINKWLAIPENVTTLKVGDHFLTKSVDAPDYWWDGTTVQILGAEKVDLTGYVKQADIVNNLSTDDSKKPLSAAQGFALDRKLNCQILESIGLAGPIIKMKAVNLQSGGSTAFDLRFPSVSAVADGLMTTTDKKKLDTVSNSAQVNVIEKISVDGTPLPVTDKGINLVISNKVDKVDNKQLSTEDFTTTHKTKLEAIGEGANANIIEKVSLNGTVLSITNKTVNIDVTNKVDKITGKGLSSNDYTTTEKNKLQGIAEGAQKNTVTSVASRTGAVVLTKSDVGLSLVNNTADLDKPISKLAATALSTKVDEAPKSGVIAYARQNGTWVETVTEVSSTQPTIPGYVRNKGVWTTLQSSLEKMIRHYGLVSTQLVEENTNNLILRPYLNGTWKGYNFFIKYNTSTTYPISFGSATDDFSEYCLTIHNNTSSTITQPIPNGTGWQSETYSVQIAAGKFCEIFIKSVKGGYIVRV